MDKKFGLKAIKYRITGYQSPNRPFQKYPYDELHAINIESRGLERLGYDREKGEELWGRERFAVCDGGSCLNKETLEFDYEPQPSSREEDWLNQVRFYSVEEALECFERFVEEEQKRYDKRERARKALA